MSHFWFWLKHFYWLAVSSFMEVRQKKKKKMFVLLCVWLFAQLTVFKHSWLVVTMYIFLSKTAWKRRVSFCVVCFVLDFFFNEKRGGRCGEKDIPLQKKSDNSPLSPGCNNIFMSSSVYSSLSHHEPGVFSSISVSYSIQVTMIRYTHKMNRWINSMFSLQLGGLWSESYSAAFLIMCGADLELCY